ncbi:MAG: hypothetical protein KAR42_09580 [candidate division Zixibacteria bacterium]|nr:hypothetical protein [candidate division Zixibacteria bacterium]
MIKKLAVFLLSLLGISILLTIIWINGAQVQYALLFKPAAIFMFKTLGIHKSGLNFVLEHFTNLIPYIALCLSIPNTSWKKKLTRLGYGLGILMVVHFTLIIAVSKVYSVYSNSETAYIFIFPMFIINDTLPLLLWFLFFSNEVLSFFKRKT